MDIIRPEVLEEMIRNGRAYRHEVQSLAHELLERRAGRDPTPFDGMTILVPSTVLAGGFRSPTQIRLLEVQQSLPVLFNPLSGPRTWAIVHRLEDQK